MVPQLPSPCGSEERSVSTFVARMRPRRRLLWGRSDGLTRWRALQDSSGTTDVRTRGDRPTPVTEKRLDARSVEKNDRVTKER